MTRRENIGSSQRSEMKNTAATAAAWQTARIGLHTCPCTHPTHTALRLGEQELRGGRPRCISYRCSLYYLRPLPHVDHLALRRYATLAHAMLL